MSEAAKLGRGHCEDPCLQDGDELVVVKRTAFGCGDDDAIDKFGD